MTYKFKFVLAAKVEEPACARFGLLMMITMMIMMAMVMMMMMKMMFRVKTCCRQPIRVAAKAHVRCATYGAIHENGHDDNDGDGDDDD